jgi:hypothetical protein
MPSAGEIRAQVAREVERRQRLAVPTLAGGVLYLLGTIILASTSKGAPTVGLLQGLKPTVAGVANPATSPRAPEVVYISHHAFGLIAGSVVTAIGLGALTLLLLFVFAATRFRRPETWSAAGPLVLVGGSLLAAITIIHQIVSAIETHKFAVGSDHTAHAVEQALTKATPIVVAGTLGLVSWLALAAGMIGTLLAALRVGLVPRWVGFLGMFSAILIFLPLGGALLEVIPAFWMVAMGILLAGKWSSGDPPAWAAGEARPWPTAAERRGAARGDGAGAKAQPAGPTKAERRAADAEARTSRNDAVPVAAEEVPEPTPAAGSAAARKRRRKRGGRG